jgi:hypothetical protein
MLRAAGFKDRFTLDAQSAWRNPGIRSADFCPPLQGYCPMKLKYTPPSFWQIRSCFKFGNRGYKPYTQEEFGQSDC